MDKELIDIVCENYCWFPKDVRLHLLEVLTEEKEGKDLTTAK